LILQYLTFGFNGKSCFVVVLSGESGMMKV